MASQTEPGSTSALASLCFCPPETCLAGQGFPLCLGVCPVLFPISLAAQGPCRAWAAPASCLLLGFIHEVAEAQPAHPC